VLDSYLTERRPTAHLGPSITVNGTRPNIHLVRVPADFGASSTPSPTCDAVFFAPRTPPLSHPPLIDGGATLQPHHGSACALCPMRLLLLLLPLLEVPAPCELHARAWGACHAPLPPAAVVDAVADASMGACDWPSRRAREDAAIDDGRAIVVTREI
jgi:hypothetical protein